MYYEWACVSACAQYRQIDGERRDITTFYWTFKHNNHFISFHVSMRIVCMNNDWTDSDLFWLAASCPIERGTYSAWHLSTAPRLTHWWSDFIDWLKSHAIRWLLNRFNFQLNPILETMLKDVNIRMAHMAFICSPFTLWRWKKMQTTQGHYRIFLICAMSCELSIVNGGSWLVHHFTNLKCNASDRLPFSSLALEAMHLIRSAFPSPLLDYSLCWSQSAMKTWRQSVFISEGAPHKIIPPRKRQLEMKVRRMAKTKYATAKRNQELAPTKICLFHFQFYFMFEWSHNLHLNVI